MTKEEINKIFDKVNNVLKEHKEELRWTLILLYDEIGSAVNGTACELCSREVLDEMIKERELVHLSEVH